MDGFSRHGYGNSGTRGATLALLAVCLLPGEPSRSAFFLSVEKPVGFAWYDLEHSGPDTTVNDITTRPMIRSELNFPLDPFRIVLGLASWRSAGGDSLARLRTGVHFWSSISPAFFRMRDEDWVGVNASGAVTRSQALVKFSDTYSSVESYLMGGGVRREFAVLRVLGAPAVIGLGLEGSRFSFEVFGLEGRQRDPENPGWVEVALPGSLKVGTYMTYTLRTSVDLRLRDPLLGLRWESRLHPLSFSHSFDDHILRKKHIEMDCWGAGGALEASLPLGSRSPSRASSLAPYLRMELDRSWGNMMQTYYADSPDTPEDETGRSTKGLRTTVNHWLISAGFRYGLGM